MRTIALLLAAASIAASADDHDPLKMFVYELNGCKSDCAAEAQAFADSGAIYLLIEGGGGTRELLLDADGTVRVAAPALSFVARRGVTAKLPRREASAIFATLDQLRERLSTKHRTWLDKPASLDSDMVTLAFGMQGKVHFVHKPAIYLQRDYVPLLVALMPYLDAEALLSRAGRVRLDIEANPPVMDIGGDPDQKWPGEAIVPLRRLRGAVLSRDQWARLADVLRSNAKIPSLQLDPDAFGHLALRAEDLEERVVTTQEPVDRAKTNLQAFRVLHEAPDHVTMQLDIFYDGSHGPEVLTCASALDNTGADLTGCRPNVVRAGRFVTCAMTVATSSGAETFETTTLRVPLYERGTGHVFYQVQLPLWKTWKRAPDGKSVECGYCNAKCLK